VRQNEIKLGEAGKNVSEAGKNVSEAG